ncbi:hypothetical protein COBT_001707, partial [Conglomerata obtusa]
NMTNSNVSGCKFDWNLYDKYHEKIISQAHELEFCLKNGYNDSSKSITPWMRFEWEKGKKDWFKRKYN